MCGGYKISAECEKYKVESIVPSYSFTECDFLKHENSEAETSIIP